ncbi:MAG: hypothetical protein M3P22_02555 [bacterium]|nr:hypothetical protein [bacterium]
MEEKPKFDYQKLITPNDKDQFGNKFPVPKGTEYYKKIMMEKGLVDQLPFFNDVIIKKIPPPIDAGYGDPMLTNVEFDNRTFDVYHSDHNGGKKYRVFLHDKTFVEDK